MRIIKLGKKEFCNLDSAKEFFSTELPKRNPVGMFGFKRRLIAKDGISAGEKVIFSYGGEIIYYALSSSGRNDSIDEDREEYPYYFQVNMNTLKHVKSQDLTLSELEKYYHLNGGEKKRFVRTQAWPQVKNETSSDLLWRFLGAE